MLAGVERAIRQGLETPAYLFDADAVIAARRALAERLGTPVVVSIKANSAPALFARTAATFVDGVEVASLGELALVAGAPVPRTVTTPALTQALLGAAIAAEATVMLDSLAQVEAVVALPQAPAVGLRINAASLTQVRTAGAIDHFGLSVEAAHAACDRLREAGIAVRGLLVHAGSNSFEGLGVTIATAMRTLIPSLNARLATPLATVNLGGGFGVDWADAPGLDDYLAALAPLRPLAGLMHEAGRAIYAAAGAFVTRVLAVKRIDDRGYVVCDGGIAQAFLLAQTERVMKRPAVPQVLRLSPGPPPDPAQFAGIAELRVTGNSCNRADVIGRLRVADLPVPGDCLVFPGMGAYHTYTPTAFLSLGAATRVVLP